MAKMWDFIEHTSCPFWKDRNIFINIRDHPFKTSARLRGGGVKNLPNLPADSTKNCGR